MKFSDQARIMLLVLSCFVTSMAFGQQQAAANYTEVFYLSGSLRIQAYLYKPAGSGPFPIVIYNHGTRDDDRESVPFQYVGNMLKQAGYMVLVPERRGYGKSDGPEWRREVGNSPSKLVPRLQKETDDVLASIDYLRTLPSADMNRLGIMGWSFGGIVTILAASRSSAFKVVVDQAGGSLSWNESAPLRDAMVAAAEQSSIPTLFMDAQNDRTTLSVTTLAEVFEKRSMPHQLIIYDPFTPAPGTKIAAPGHAVFAAQGMPVWKNDVVQFLGRYLGMNMPNTSGSATTSTK